MTDHLASHIPSSFEDAASDILSTTIIIACDAYNKAEAILSAEGRGLWTLARQDFIMGHLQEGALHLLMSNYPVLTLARKLTGKKYEDEEKSSTMCTALSEDLWREIQEIQRAKMNTETTLSPDDDSP